MKNIITLLFLGLMITSAIFAVITYNKLKKEKIKSQGLLIQLEHKDSTNKVLKEQTDSITAELTKLLYNSNSHRTKSKTDTAETKLIQELKTVNENYTKANNKSAYQQAYVFEKEGFEALVKNDFELALMKIALAEKASPGFHMCNEISALLRSKRKEFKDPQTQLYIKKQIIENLSWKAPSGLLKILKTQVTDPLTKPISPVINTTKWPVKKN